MSRVSSAKLGRIRSNSAQVQPSLAELIQIWLMSGRWADFGQIPLGRSKGPTPPPTPTTLGPGTSISRRTASRRVKKPAPPQTALAQLATTTKCFASGSAATEAAEAAARRPSPRCPPATQHPHANPWRSDARASGKHTAEEQVACIEPNRMASAREQGAPLRCGTWRPPLRATRRVPNNTRTQRARLHDRQGGRCARLQAEFGRDRPNSGQSWSMPGQTWRKLAETRPTSVDVALS